MSPVAPISSGSALYATALRQVDVAARLLNLETDMLRVLRTPKRVFTAQVPFMGDDGEIQISTGYRVQHNINRGPAIGGLRYHASATVEDVIAQAMLMTWRCALIGLPFGGAAGAVLCDPAALSVRELERMTRRYATEMAIVIGPARDVVMPDYQTDSQVMAWIMDTYSMHEGYSVPAVVAGKPVSIGGSEGYQDATAQGVRILMREAAGLLGLDIRGLRVAVQGFGAVGAATALLLHQSGCTVVAVSDAGGGVYNAHGLDMRALIEHDRLASRVGGFVGAEDISNQDLLTCDCDVLVLAALDSHVSSSNAASVRARLLLEAASGAVTGEADQILEERGITVLPDILCGAGGVTVCYFEWVQGLQESFWTEAQVYQRLQDALVQAFSTVRATRDRLNTSFRAAAYAQAIDAVASATELRGIYP